MQHPFLQDAEQLLARAREICNAASTKDALEQFRVAFLGRKGELAILSDRFVTLSIDDKRAAGPRFQEIKRELDSLYDARKAKLDNAQSTQNTSILDVTQVAPQRTHKGGLHVYRDRKSTRLNSSH